MSQGNKKKSGMTLLETSIAMTVLSIILMGFYKFIDTRVDDWHKKETLRRMEVLEDEVIKYVAETYDEYFAKGWVIFPNVSGTEYNIGKIRKYSALDPNNLNNTKTKNTQGNDFFLITGLIFNQIAQFNNLRQLALDFAHTDTDGYLDRNMYFPDVYAKFSHSKHNNYLQHLKDNENFIVFSLCDEGVLGKSKPFCKAVPISKFMYKVNALNNQYTSKNQIIKVEYFAQDLAAARTIIASKPNKFYTFLINNQFVTNVLQRSGRANVKKKIKPNDLIWHTSSDSLFRVDSTGKLVYLSSVDEQKNAFLTANWAKNVTSATNKDLYAVNGNSGKLLQVDEQGQKVDFISAADKTLIFDQNQGNLKFYDQSEDIWKNAVLEIHTPPTPPDPKEHECGGMPCAIPGIRKCGPPIPSNPNKDIYGRYIVNDIFNFLFLADRSKRKINNNNDNWDYNNAPDGLYLINFDYWHGALTGQTTPYIYAAGDYNFVNTSNSSTDRNKVAFLVKKQGSKYIPFKDVDITGNQQNIENAVSNKQNKPFEVCKKGIGVFSETKEMNFKDPTTRTIYPFLAIIDGEILEIDQKATAIDTPIVNKKSMLIKHSASAPTENSLWCAQKNYQFLYYRNEDIGQFNPIVGFFANEPFKVKIKGVAAERNAVAVNTQMTYRPTNVWDWYLNTLLKKLYVDNKRSSLQDLNLIKTNNNISPKQIDLVSKSCNLQSPMALNTHHKIKIWKDPDYPAFNHVWNWGNIYNGNIIYQYNQRKAYYSIHYNKMNYAEFFNVPYKLIALKREQRHREYSVRYDSSHENSIKNSYLGMDGLGSFGATGLIHYRGNNGYRWFVIAFDPRNNRYMSYKQLISMEEINKEKTINFGSIYNIPD